MISEFEVDAGEIPARYSFQLSGKFAQARTGGEKTRGEIESKDNQGSTKSFLERREEGKGKKRTLTYFLLSVKKRVWS